MRVPASLLVAVLCVSGLAAGAQTYTAKKIAFNHRGTFSQQQLEEAAQLHAGSSFTTDQLAAAAQRINDSGYFEDVGASFDGNTVLFDLKPVDRSHFLPVRFANLVWLSDDEAAAAIRQVVPLYNGLLTENSTHQQEVKAALLAALAKKSVTAVVNSDTYQPTLFHPKREIEFFISRPEIYVQNVKLAGVKPELVPLLQKSVNATVQTTYTVGPADRTTSDRMLAPLLDAGYIQAKVLDLTPTPTEAAAGRLGVVLSATLQPGEVFHVESITFAGSPLLSADAFKASAKLHAGDIASRQAMLETLQPIDTAYRRLGYMDVIVEAVPTPDAATHQVAYNVTVLTGEQYRIHEVVANNLDPAAQADFDRNFQMKSGQLYNPSYVAEFMKANTALKSFQGYLAAFRAVAYPETHTVDLTITFVKPVKSR